MCIMLKPIQLIKLNNEYMSFNDNYICFIDFPNLPKTLMQFLYELEKYNIKTKNVLNTKK